MSTNIEFASGTCQQSIELGLMKSLSSNISKTQAHIAVANVEAAALCLHLIWKVRPTKIRYRRRSIVIRVIFKSMMSHRNPPRLKSVKKYRILSCMLFTFNVMVKHRNIIHRSLDLDTSDLKAVNGLLNETPTLFFCIDICTFVSPLALLTTKAWYNTGNHDRLNLFLVRLIFKTPIHIFLSNFASREKRWEIKSRHFW